LKRRDILKSVGLAVVARATAGWAAADVAQPFSPDVELALTAEPGEARILAGTPTRVWRYTGRVIKGPREALQPVPDSYLGPTLRLQRGQRVRIRFANRLQDSTIVHWHGLDLPEAADGHPRLAVASGGSYVYEFTVTDPAGTYWYHPHPHMQTGSQVYRGLAGLLVVEDPREKMLALPSGQQELTWVIQDRRLDTRNQLVYSNGMMDAVMGFLGNRILVNGQERPQLSLATRAYRARILNGSNARIYKLGWSDGTPLTVIGGQGGLLDVPVTQPFVTLAPAQRVDLWVDLGSRPVGTTLELRSVEFAAADGGFDMAGMMGMRGMRGMGRGRMMMGNSGDLPQGSPVSLLSIRVARREQDAAVLPARLAPAAPALAAPGAAARRIALDMQGMQQWTIDGRVFEMTGVAANETVAAGSTHDWEFVNAGGPMGMQMAHAMHMHGRHFRVVARSGGNPANTLRDGLVDQGWTDTVLVLPQESVRVRVTFSSHRGLFLYHCHILEHEDMGMMRNFRIV
jgi:FtsP/CotA-like multicopper oxidase with cupredoxin domain